jgi:hypothetical protein
MLSHFWVLYWLAQQCLYRKGSVSQHIILVDTSKHEGFWANKVDFLRTTVSHHELGFLIATAVRPSNHAPLHVAWHTHWQYEQNLLDMLRVMLVEKREVHAVWSTNEAVQVYICTLVHLAWPVNPFRPFSFPAWHLLQTNLHTKLKGEREEGTRVWENTKLCCLLPLCTVLTRNT